MPTRIWPGAARLSRQVLGSLLLLFAQQCQTFRNVEVSSCIYCKSYHIFIWRRWRLEIVGSRSTQAEYTAQVHTA